MNHPVSARQPIPASAIEDTPLPKPPAIIAPLVSGLMWERMACLSGRLVMQLRSLGAVCREGVGGRFDLIVDEPASLTPIAAAHAWMVAMAQPAALELRRLEAMEMEEPMPEPPSDIAEISAASALAGCVHPRGSGRRLAAALSEAASKVVHALHKRGVDAQVLFARPVQTVSPVTHQTAVPLSILRMRASGISPEELRQTLKEAIHNQGSISGGEILVLSLF